MKTGYSMIDFNVIFPIQASEFSKSLNFGSNLQVWLQDIHKFKTLPSQKLKLCWVEQETQFDALNWAFNSFTCIEINVLHAFNARSILCVVNYRVISNIHNRTPKSGILFTDMCIIPSHAFNCASISGRCITV